MALPSGKRLTAFVVPQTSAIPYEYERTLQCATHISNVVTTYCPGDWHKAVSNVDGKDTGLGNRPTKRHCVVVASFALLQT